MEPGMAFRKFPKEKRNYHSQFRGTIRHIVFKNIQVAGGSLPFSVFHGFDAEKNISGITIENLTYLGRRLLTTEDARIRLQNTKDFVIR